MAAPRGLRNQDCLQALPNPERAAPSERVPAILTAAPSIVLERDAGGAAHPARARGWFLNPAPTTLVGDLRLEPLSRLLRVSRECEPGQVVPFREDVLRLPKEHANFGRTEVVRLRLLQNGLARADDRLGLLDLGLAELHRPLDLSLLAFHREPLRPLEQIAGVAVLSDGDRGPRGLMELLRLLRVCADVPGEGDVIGDESDRFLDLANSSKPRVLRTPAFTGSGSSGSHGSKSPCAARTAYDQDARRSCSVVRSAMRDASCAAVSAASNCRSWNLLRACSRSSSTRS